jgi:tRNA U55 pseudouridine synthase TruB
MDTYEYFYSRTYARTAARQIIAALQKAGYETQMFRIHTQKISNKCFLSEIGNLYKKSDDRYRGSIINTESHVKYLRAIKAGEGVFLPD